MQYFEYNLNTHNKEKDQSIIRTCNIHVITIRRSCSKSHKSHKNINCAQQNYCQGKLKIKY